MFCVQPTKHWVMTQHPEFVDVTVTALAAR
jgi:hypothetical protein